MTVSFKKMTIGICFGVLSMASNTAFAGSRFETNCNFNDCLKEGWQTTQWGTFNKAETVCKDKDCTKNGWQTQASNGVSEEVSCDDGGCFVNGWSTTQFTPRGTYQLVLNCRKGDCLKFGWSAQ